MSLIKFNWFNGDDECGPDAADDDLSREVFIAWAKSPKLISGFTDGYRVTGLLSNKHQLSPTQFSDFSSRENVVKVSLR